MNDGQNAYAAFEIGRGTYGAQTAAGLVFDNGNDGAFTQGEDVIAVDIGVSSPLTFRDGYLGACTPGGSPNCLLPDSHGGGTSEGTGAAGVNGSATVIEMSHPLNDVDDAHDWSVGPGDIAGVSLFTSLSSENPSCSSGCLAYTSYPEGTPSGWGDVVIAPDALAPDTTIVGSPRELTRSGRAIFKFSGTDNLTPVEQLTFACSLDAHAFAPCAQAQTFHVANGRHRLLVQARDEVGNVDPTPAEFRWRVDSTKPTRPRIVLSVVGKSARVTLSSHDRDDPARMLGFRCAMDRTRWQTCHARFRRTLRAGSHLLRVRAVDPAGNSSSVSMSRFSLKVR